MFYILLGNIQHSFNRLYKQYSDCLTNDLIGDFSFDDHILVYDINQIPDGSSVFYVSYPHILSHEMLNKFRHNIVIHASDLPKGRGWSPHVWQILDGNTSIYLSALTVQAKVDTGPIWAKSIMNIPNTVLFDEISEIIFRSHLKIMGIVEKMINSGLCPSPQSSESPTYYERRIPSDSQVTVQSSIEDIFDLLRVSDPVEYPVFFKYRGKSYELKISQR